MLNSLDDITPDILKSIEDLAALFFTPMEIALQLEIDQKFFIDKIGEDGNPIYRSFQSGRLQSEVELRRSILKLAKSGSSPAQTMALEIFMKSKIQMLS